MFCLYKSERFWCKLNQVFLVFFFNISSSYCKYLHCKRPINFQEKWSKNTKTKNLSSSVIFEIETYIFSLGLQVIIFMYVWVFFMSEKLTFYIEHSYWQNFPRRGNPISIFFANTSVQKNHSHTNRFSRCKSIHAMEPHPCKANFTKRPFLVMSLKQDSVWNMLILCKSMSYMYLCYVPRCRVKQLSSSEKINKWNSDYQTTSRRAWRCDMESKNIPSIDRIHKNGWKHVSDIEKHFWIGNIAFSLRQFLP